MRQVNIHEAKTHFSELIAAVERGEEMVIARRGKPVARLAPPTAAVSEEAAKGAPRSRVFGQWAGRICVDPSFFEPMSEGDLDEWSKDRPAFDDVNRITRSRRAG